MALLLLLLLPPLLLLLAAVERSVQMRADLGAVGLSTRAEEALRLRTMADTVAQTILVRKL